MARYSLGGSKTGLGNHAERMRRLLGMAKELGVKDPQAVRDAAKAKAANQLRNRSGQFIKPGPEGAWDRIEAMEYELEPVTNWIPVSSSNVEAVRWVGGTWGLQVMFLPKKSWPRSTYEYNVGYTTFRAMMDASSKGSFVWGMRRAQIPYHRLSGGRGGLKTILYPFGGIRKGKRVRYPKKAIGKYFKHWATPGYHPPGTHKP